MVSRKVGCSACVHAPQVKRLQGCAMMQAEREELDIVVSGTQCDKVGHIPRLRQHAVVVVTQCRRVVSTVW